ncbi:MAG TPA: hypothetical protein VFB12_30740, partial [Ktedonobacteraceae bacterium]|nr:hypothetical protein [Ktedonobacteraceae bacterium]
WACSCRLLSHNLEWSVIGGTCAVRREDGDDKNSRAKSHNTHICISLHLRYYTTPNDAMLVNSPREQECYQRQHAASTHLWSHGLSKHSL